MYCVGAGADVRIILVWGDGVCRVGGIQTRIIILRPSGSVSEEERAYTTPLVSKGVHVLYII